MIYSEQVAAHPLDVDKPEECSLMFMKYVYYPAGRALRSAKSFVMVVYENIFTARRGSCGKVMFSHACDCPQGVRYRWY